MTKPSKTTETFVPDNLIAGDQKLITREITVLSGQTLIRGSLLGAVTASGKYLLSLSGAGDGSQTPGAILIEDVDASAGDAVGAIYEQGEFNENAIIFGTGHTVGSVRAGLRGFGMHLKASTPA